MRNTWLAMMIAPAITIATSTSLSCPRRLKLPDRIIATPSNAHARGRNGFVSRL